MHLFIRDLHKYSTIKALYLLHAPPRYINGRQSIIRAPFRFNFFNPTASTTASAIPRSTPRYRVKGLLYTLRTVKPCCEAYSEQRTVS